MSELIKALNEKYSALNKQIADIREQMTNESKQYIEQACKELFEACPEVHQIHWTQYTPHFNDGEACEFSVNEVNFVLVADLNEDGEWEDSYWEGSVIYDQEDIERCEANLATAAAFTADPDAWRKDQYGLKYVDAKEREARGEFSTLHSWRIPHVLTAKPYPSDPTDAMRELERVKKAVADTEGRADIIKAHVNGVISFIQKIDEDVMQALFGDHVSVCITRDGVEIDEYDHD